MKRDVRKALPKKNLKDLQSKDVCKNKMVDEIIIA
jgi:hypothetical protein